jgi:hypothetical protein
VIMIFDISEPEHTITRGIDHKHHADQLASQRGRRRREAEEEAELTHRAEVRERERRR